MSNIVIVNELLSQTFQEMLNKEMLWYNKMM
jgi:hypothetical protein